MLSALVFAATPLVAAAAATCPAPSFGGTASQRPAFEAIRGNLAYPAPACAEGRGGTVVARFRALNGEPFEVEIRKSSGDARLDHAVLVAVTRAKSLPDSGEVTVTFKSH